MPLWTKNQPPVFKPNAVATDKGWVDPDTGEILVSISVLNQAAGAADIVAVIFSDETDSQGAPLSVTVRYNERVNVTVGASIVVSFDGEIGDITLYAAAQSGVQDVIFNKQSDNTTAEVVPSAVVASQTLTNDGTNVTDLDTVTIDGKVYTFQDTLTDVDGNVKIGASAAASMTNLFHAINASGGVAGTDYALSTVAHDAVEATNPSATTVVVAALEAGAAGNALAVSEASTHLSWGAATLAGGQDNAGTLSIAAQSVSGTIIDANQAVRAVGTLTFTGQPADSQTVVIDGKPYTFKTTLTNTDGFVKIGSTVDESIENLAGALSLSAGGSGSTYAAATVAHTTVRYKSHSATTLVVEAITAGTGGNALTTTDTVTNASWGGATLAGGSAGTASNAAISAGVAAACETVEIELA